MSNYVGVIRKHFRPYIQSFLDDWRQRKDTEFFRPTGTQMYVGQQGSGKTISAVKHVLAIKSRYMKCIIVSNIDLKYLKPLSLEDYVENDRQIQPDQYIQFQTMDELGACLTEVNNDKRGVMYLVDEIHTYFNALESKNIPMYVFTEISQQRKQRKCIVATSQLFMRTAKPFREQCDNVIICRTILGFITFTVAYDGAALSQEGDEKAKQIHKKRMGWFFHTRKLRDAYDTYQKVVSGHEQYEQQQITNVNIRKLKHK
jgi:hypothetical protein